MKRFMSVFLVLSLCFSLNAQSLKIGVGGGPAFANGDENVKKLGFDNGYQIGGKAKVGFLLPFSLVGQISYFKLTGEGAATGELVNGQVVLTSEDVNTTLLTTAAGGQFEIIPGPLTPHLDFDLLYTSFDYDIKDAESTNRIGVGLGAGIDLKLLPMFDLEIGLKYNMHNLIGKEDGEGSMNTVTFTASVLFDIL